MEGFVSGCNFFFVLTLASFVFGRRRHSLDGTYRYFMHTIFSVCFEDEI